LVRLPPRLGIVGDELSYRFFFTAIAYTILLSVLLYVLSAVFGPYLFILFLKNGIINGKLNLIPITYSKYLSGSH
jgi:hypothetical protein